MGTAQVRYSAEFKQATIAELLLGEKRAAQICREAAGLPVEGEAPADG